MSSFIGSAKQIYMDNLFRKVSLFEIDQPVEAFHILALFPRLLSGIVASWLLLVWREVTQKGTLATTRGNYAEPIKCNLLARHQGNF